MKEVVREGGRSGALERGERPKNFLLATANGVATAGDGDAEKPATTTG